MSVSKIVDKHRKYVMALKGGVKFLSDNHKVLIDVQLPHTPQMYRHFIYHSNRLLLKKFNIHIL